MTIQAADVDSPHGGTEAPAHLPFSEATAITLDDVDLEKGQLLVRGKGAKERIVPLSRLAIEAIIDYLRVRPHTACRRLFVSRAGAHPIHGRLVSRMMSQVLRRAGLAENGITPHKLLQTTARYLHSDIRTKRAAVTKITSLIGAGEAPR